MGDCWIVSGRMVNPKIVVVAGIRPFKTLMAPLFFAPPKGFKINVRKLKSVLGKEGFLANAYKLNPFDKKDQKEIRSIQRMLWIKRNNI
ncbi:MAG: hypothetical protein ABIE23_02665 [archaeon]